MPIIKLRKEDFPLIDWREVRRHVAAQYEQVETSIELFTRSERNGWQATIKEPDPEFDTGTAIVCRFWLDPQSRRQRPRLTDPDRTAYITRRERSFLENFLRTITSQPWLNLKVVWLKSDVKGIIVIHFKVYDYEPFLREKTTAPHSP